MCGCGIARYRPPQSQSTPQQARKASEESSAVTQPASEPAANVYVLPESGGAAPSPKPKGEIALADVLGS